MISKIGSHLLYVSFMVVCYVIWIIEANLVFKNGANIFELFVASGIMPLALTIGVIANDYKNLKDARAEAVLFLLVSQWFYSGMLLYLCQAPDIPLFPWMYLSFPCLSLFVLWVFKALTNPSEQQDQEVTNNDHGK